MIRIEKTTLLAALLLLAACSSSSPTGATAEPDGGLLGMQADNKAYWEEWSQEAPTPFEVDDALRPAVIFDAWLIDDDAFQQQVWDPLFHALNALAIHGDNDVSKALRALMVRLEPGVEEIHWELSFLSQGSGDAEGIVLRIASDDGAGVWLEATRSASGSSTPWQWILRAEPAAREVDGLTAWFHRDDDQWEVTYATGADATDATSEVLTTPVFSELASLWNTYLWDAVSGRAYLEPEFSISDHGDDDPADGWPSSLGMSVEQRGIDEFISDTVFTPRLGEEDLEDF